MCGIAVRMTSLFLALFLLYIEVEVQVTAQIQVSACKNPRVPTNSFIHYPRAPKSQYNLWEKIYYGCNRGFVPIGRATHECRPTGWSSLNFKCVDPRILGTKKVCNNPGTPKNGTRKGILFTVGSKILFSCKDGYDLTGESEITCLSNSVWSGQHPTCHPRCHDPGNLANGWRVGADFRHSGQVFYFCLRGYRLQGSDVLKCQDGKWSSLLPNCTVRTCAKPEIPRGAALFQLKRQTSSSATAHFTCKRHLYRSGTPVLHCSWGVWSKPTFTCTDYCPNFAPLKNGRIEYSIEGDQRVARAFCNNDTVMDMGNSVIRCVNKEWNGITPICGARCHNPGQPEHGARFGSNFAHNETVTFQCRDGYKLNGQNTLKCFDENWSSSIPKCEGVPCDAPVPFNYSRIVFPENWNNRKYFHGHVIVHACKRGSLNGHGSSICINGTWTPLKFECPVLCPRSIAIPNGRVIWKSMYKGGVVELKCRFGFTLEGPSRLTCVNGKWPIYRKPQCQAPCLHPGKLTHGTKLGSNYRHGKKIRYQCWLTYIIDGADTLTCNNRRWDNPVPSCLVPCKLPKHPQSGHRIGDDFVHGSQIRYWCNDHYTLTGGSKVRTCNNGSWSGKEPRCEMIQCDNPGTPINGQQNAPRGYVYGEVVHFTCKARFTMEGNSSIVCRKDKTWTGTVPKCLAPCFGPGGVQHGSKSGSDYRHGKKVQYHCWPSYILDGAHALTCIDGDWDNSVPNCLAPCKAPAHPRYGAVIGDDFRHGSQVRYRCDNGFMLRGVTPSTCNNGLWSPKDAPECICCSGEFDTSIGSCCSPSTKCPALHGDCDRDSDCQYGLVCGTNNCQKKPFFLPGEDCCVPTCSGDTNVLVGDCCSPPFHKCPAYHGDCDWDSDCQDGLVCGTNNCPKKPGFSPYDDCCHRSCSGDIKTRHADCCTPMNKCPANHGDCDSDDDCQYGHKCGVDNCPRKPGFRSHYDCCVPICSGEVDIETDHCCSPLNKCPENHGDCDSDDHCQEGLHCGTNNCPQKIAFDSQSDCCAPVCSGNFKFNHRDCCTPLNKCPAFHGDCDSDADCEDGLVCGTDNCLPTKPGFRSHYDCCVPDCEQRTKGGSCCVFPFKYDGDWYTSCTSKDHSLLWCSKTQDYNRDERWGNCN